MPAQINYKNKYLELRAKYMNDLDMAFRLGFEQGQQQQQQNQMAEDQANQMAMEQAALQGQAAGAGGPPGADGGGEGGPAGQPSQPGAGDEPGSQPTQPGNAAPQSSELDQHIATLEGLIGSGGSDPAKSAEIKKSLTALKAIRKSQLQAIELQKSEMAIQGIAKALHKPKFKLTRQASHNLSSNAKQAVSMQQKLVEDVMKKMEEEERKASNSISNILDVEGLTQG